MSRGEMPVRAATARNEAPTGGQGAHAPDRRVSLRSVAARAGVRAGPVVVAVLLWQWAAAATGSPFFPPPGRIAERMAELSLGTDLLWQDAGPSVVRALVGWGGGALAGVLIGLVAGQWTAAAGYVDPPVNFLRSLPKPAIVPVFLLVFGSGDLMRIGLITFGCVWPVLLNTMQGVRSVDPMYRETARAFHIPMRTQLLRVIIPAALPKIAAGMRVTLSLSLILMVLSEWLLADDGLGHFLINAQRTFEILDVWAAIVLLGAIGYLLNVLFLAAERRVLRSRPA